MGDGSYNKRDNRMVLHTENFSLETNELISKELNSKFNLHTKVWRSSIYYNVNIPSKDVNTIIKLVKPYILKDFLYKINSDNKDYSI